MTVSPEATGQAGASFEHHVDAAFLAFLLVRGTPPFLLNCELVQVHLQAGHLDWETDDLLLVGLGADGNQRLAAIQVKRTFVLRPSDKDCVEVFSRAWADFRSDRFEIGRDVVGLITRPCGAETQRGLRILIDSARAATNGSDLRRRLSIPGYRDKAALKFYTVIRGIIETSHGEEISDDEMIEFLRHFDFSPLDLNSTSSVTEALLLTFLRACENPDSPPGSSNNTWNELLKIVGRDASDAASFRRDELPQELLERHRSVGSITGTMLDDLAEMTRTIMVGVESTVAGYHVPRFELEQEALAALEHGRVVVLAGDAGSGKSAIARTIFNATSSGHLSIAMRAGMLAKSHLAETVLNQEISILRLRELAALHSQKLFWIESGERLLEKADGERQAFKDLLRLIGEDKDWKILITCRSYSVETFRSAFLEGAGTPCSVLSIPPLRDDELIGVEQGCPQLKIPLSVPSLRSLLRNPFLLGKAALMAWDKDAEIPTSRRSFRRKVWQEVIMRNDVIAAGMPERRGECYVQLARRRAQSLASFVPVADLDRDALGRLKADTLAFESRGMRGFWAPSHDVLEDWALHEWLDYEFGMEKGRWPSFLSKIGTHPAVRRAFRLWLSERVEDDSSVPVTNVASLVQAPTLAAHWRDDALVAIMSGPNPDDFLSRNRSLVLANNAAVLRRAIHVVRVACKETCSDLEPAHSSMYLIPVGPAWASLACCVAENLELMLRVAGPLLRRFAEDWALMVTRENPYPEGSEALGRIVVGLLEAYDLSRTSTSRQAEGLLRVLIKIPKVAEPEIRAVASECLSAKSLDTDHVFVRLSLNRMYDSALCRDLPNIVVRLVERMTEPDDEPDEGRSYWGLGRQHKDLNDAFGLPKNLHRLGFPASAHHGPYLGLLESHPGAGLGFVVGLVNKCAERYFDLSNSEFHRGLVVLRFKLPNGSEVLQRGDAALWNMYRINSGPDLLRSALMALEKYLLEVGEHAPKVLPVALERVMTEANNVALTSVVASVVMAYPELNEEIALSLLSFRIVFSWDRNRLVNDRMPFTGAVFSSESLEDTWYQDERAASARLPHRQGDLSLLALNLQRTAFKERVWKILDRHHDQLPPSEVQSVDDKQWRLMLHQMDTRTFERKGVTEDGYAIFQPSPPPRDVQQVIDDSVPHTELFESLASLKTWGVSCYERKDSASYQPSHWQEKLRSVREMEQQDTSFGYWDPRLMVAVVCCRDFFPKMSEDERDWCVNTVGAVFSAQRAQGRSRMGLPLGPLDGGREAAFSISKVLSESMGAAQRRSLERSLVNALLSDDHDIGSYAFAGIGVDMWSTDRDLALAYVNALVTQVGLVHDAARAEPRVGFDEDRSAYDALVVDADIEAHRIVAERVSAASGSLTLDYRTRPWALTLRRLTECFGERPGDEIAMYFFERAGEQLRSSWVNDNGRHSGRQYRDDVFDRDSELVLLQGLTSFLAGLAPEAAAKFVGPFADMANEYPAKVARLARTLASAADRRASIGGFWPAWCVLTKTLVDVMSRETEGVDRREISRVLFLNLSWNESTTEWGAVKGRESSFEAMFKTIPPDVEATEAFACFVQKIGSSLLPDVLCTFAAKISDAPLTDNAIYLFELILARLVHGGDLRIRDEKELRSATLSILDILVNAGSSLAFKLRDDFVTPLCEKYVIPEASGA